MSNTTTRLKKDGWLTDLEYAIYLRGWCRYLRTSHSHGNEGPTLDYVSREIERRVDSYEEAMPFLDEMVEKAREKARARAARHRQTPDPPIDLDAVRERRQQLVSYARYENGAMPLWGGRG